MGERPSNRPRAQQDRRIYLLKILLTPREMPNQLQNSEADRDQFDALWHFHRARASSNPTEAHALVQRIEQGVRNSQNC